MSKMKKTEQKLFDALDILLSGKPVVSDGRVTQENIAMEAGVSRATFNRYSKVVDEYRLARSQKDSDGRAAPFTIEDKNRELQESNIELRQKLSLKKTESEIQVAGARQEIFVLTMALKARDNTIGEKDREIAWLKRQLVSARQEKPSHLELVSDAEN